jgi:hypothetical protein
MAWTTFAAVTSEVTTSLDGNFNILSALTPIPVSVSGTNTLVLTSIQAAGSVTAYANYMQFAGVAVATNTGAVTAQFGSLAALSVYKDTLLGPEPLTGSEIVQNCELSLMYDSTLNSGAGGFHLQARSSATTRNLSATGTITWSAILPGATQDQIVPLPGCLVGDIATLGPPASVPSGIMLSAYISGAGSVSVRAANVTSGSTITPASVVYRVGALGYN